MTAPSGWAELLTWMQQQSAAGKLDPEDAWQTFRALATTPDRAGLAELAVRFRAAPAGDRLALAATIAGLLAPVEWPTTWQDARAHLVTALTALVRSMDRHAPGSLAGTLPLDLDAVDLYDAGIAQLATARDLLRTPCRRDQLPLIARMCNLGCFSCWRALGRALLSPSEGARASALVAARSRYAIDLAVYAEAARAMNQACGAALFTGLEPGFDQGEAA
jgi:hypothetical protein